MATCTTPPETGSGSHASCHLRNATPALGGASHSYSYGLFGDASPSLRASRRTPTTHLLSYAPHRTPRKSCSRVFRQHSSSTARRHRSSRTNRRSPDPHRSTSTQSRTSTERRPAWPRAPLPGRPGSTWNLSRLRTDITVAGDVPVSRAISRSDWSGLVRSMLRMRAREAPGSTGRNLPSLPNRLCNSSPCSFARGRCLRRRPTVPGAREHNSAMRRSDQSRRKPSSCRAALSLSRSESGRPWVRFRSRASRKAACSPPSKYTQLTWVWPSCRAARYR